METAEKLLPARAILHRQRDEYTRWFNDELITDELQVLDLLSYRERYDFDYRKRYLEREGGRIELIVKWYREGDSGGDRSGYYYFQVDQALIQRLIEAGALECYRTPYLGGYSERLDRWQLSERGKSRRTDLQREMLDAAKGIIVEKRGALPEYLSFAFDQVCFSRGYPDERFGCLIVLIRPFDPTFNLPWVSVDTATRQIAT